MNETTPMRIDIVSDVVCPWCVVGFRQLQHALGAAGLDARVAWHPFELNPGMPEEGEDLQEHVAAKYGATPAQSAATRERITALGAEVGFRFAFADDMRIVNTFRAHQLLMWAGTRGRQHDLAMALFTAYFGERRDVHDPRVLRTAATAIGLDGDEAAEVLEDGRFAGAVREMEQFWTSRGIQGVPAIVLDQRHLVSGAQGIDGYRRILSELIGA